MKRALPLLFVTACAPVHLEVKEPKVRELDPPVMPTEVKAEDAPPGSLFRQNERYRLFADTRAFQLGDIVIVAVEEQANAERSRDTEIDRESRSSADLGVTVPIEGVPLAFDIGGNAGSDTRFRANNKSGRSENLVATVPAVVKRVFQNGNLFIEGRRAVLVNEEEQHLYVSGVIRPIDIDDDNVVKSERLAEAEIEFVGKGVLTDNARQSWLSRFLGWAWPF